MDDSSRTEHFGASAATRTRVDVASTTTPHGTNGHPPVVTLDRQPTSTDGSSRAHETPDANWSRRQTEVLLKIATALNQIGELDDLMVTIASAVAAATGTEFTSVYAYDETHSRTVASGMFGVPHYTPDLSAAAHLSPTDVPAEAEVIRTGKTLYRTPDTPFPDPVQMDEDWSDVVVPLIADGGVQGVLYARQAGVIRTFHREEIDLLEGIGSLAALAIVRARESEAARRRADHLELLNHLGRVLNADLDLHALCATIYNETSRIVPSDAFFVALYDQGSDWIWFPFMVDRTEIAPPSWHPIGSGPTSHVIKTRQSLIVNRDNSPIYRRSRHFGAADHTVESALFVPLLSDNRLIGVLSVQRYDNLPYLTDDIRTIETIAHQSAAALARAQLFERIAQDRDAAERHAADLRAVLTVSHAIASTANLDTMLDILATETRSLMPHDQLTLYRVSDDGKQLKPLVSRGADPPPVPRSLDPDRDLDAIDRVFLTGIPKIIGPEQPNPTSESALPSDDPAERPTCEVLIPLVIGDQISGVLHLSRDSHHPFSAQEFTIVQILAEQAAVAIRNAELRSYNRNLYLAGIRALTSAVDAKDPYTCGHSERVSLLAGRLAEALGQDAETVETVTLAGLMHDIGKIGIPDAILQKPGKLDGAEQAIMMRHAEIGAEILVNSGTQALLPLAELVRHHHEWFNGGGYPAGLAGDAIPIGARIIAVADAYDTMVTDRPYRKRRPVSEAIAELRRCAATQFDPNLIETFIKRVVRRDRTTDELNRSTGVDFAMQSRSGETTSVTLAEAGRISDARTLGLLVELADLTRHLTDLEPFLARVAEMVRRRMEYDATYLLLVNRVNQEFELAAWSDIDELPEQTAFRQPLDVGICGHVYRTGMALNVVDVSKEPMFFNPDPLPAQGSELVVPLIVDRQVIGVLSAESPRIAAFTSADVTLLTAVADQVAIAIHVAQIHDNAKRAAATDPLTGLANHGAFYDKLGESASSGEPFALVLFDVEGLKRVNDTAGHLAGDTLLREIAAELREGVRDHDLVARYGGDEFGLILRGVNRRDATRIAARIRRNFLERRGRNLPVPTTVRFGVATAPNDGNRAIDLVAIADARMYDMRNVARNGPTNGH